jgi:hypothetical protein
LGNANFQLAKGGIFRFDADPARLRVYKGEAVALVGEKVLRVREGRQLAFNGTEWIQSYFDTKDTDALYRWSQRRAENIAVANVSAARQSGNSFDSYSNGGYGMAGYGGYGSYGGYGYGYGSYGGYGGFGGSWMFNPYFGMFTFLPYYETAWSPFGFAYYTPITVVPVYAYAPVQQPVTPGRPGPGKPAQPGASGRTVGYASVTPRGAGGNTLRTPAFTSAAGMRTAAVTHGIVGSHSSFGGGYSSGYSGHSAGASGGYYSSSSSVSSVSSASSGHVSAGAASGGGGSGRSH